MLTKSDAPWFRWTGDSSPEGPHGWKSGLQAFTLRIMEDVVPLLNASTAESVRQEIALSLDEQQHPVLIHGDLSPEHILVNTETGEISVIDFGDSGMGDPAYDVMDELLPWYDNPNRNSAVQLKVIALRLTPFVMRQP
ncbi:aminoglycoside phosphotransferase family protein [Alicyclobacillus sp. SO9]|uniref:aminoglycoside phosphotransferase family protein n=1 Tax=Alicyclobacillus sp. SO9 TaxID=2665646 RepID=UPI001E344D00|nr:aminoglycoside phosphotransferase family protein [Alicyclobacillus sp. SO9]